MKRIAYLFMTFLCVCAGTTAGQPPSQVPHPEFTRLKVTQIQVGMTPQIIEALFGIPDLTSNTTLGTQTSKPWTALVYEYVKCYAPSASEPANFTPEEIDRSYENVKAPRCVYNTFYFSLRTNPPRLGYWSVNFTY